MSYTKSSTPHTVTRITLYIPKPYKTVIQKLHSSISTHSRNGLAIVDKVSSKEEFETATNTHLGPHGFMHFASLEHGDWLPLYGVHTGKAVTRMIFGNPQIAITMLRHDVRAGLFAPVEALIIDQGEEGTEVVYVKPSQLVVGSDKGNGELKEAAEGLDKKLEALWDWVAEA